MRLIIRKPETPLWTSAPYCSVDAKGIFSLSKTAVELMKARIGSRLDFAEDEDAPGSWYVSISPTGSLELRKRGESQLAGAGREFVKMMGLPVAKNRLMLGEGIPVDGRLWYRLGLPEGVSKKPHKSTRTPTKQAAKGADSSEKQPPAAVSEPANATQVHTNDPGNGHAPDASPLTPADVQRNPLLGVLVDPVLREKLQEVSQRGEPNLEVQRHLREQRTESTEQQASVPAAQAPADVSDTPVGDTAAVEPATEAPAEPAAEALGLKVFLAPDGEMRLPESLHTRLGAKAGDYLSLVKHRGNWYLLITKPTKPGSGGYQLTRQLKHLRAKVWGADLGKLREDIPLEVRRLRLLTLLIPLAAATTTLPDQPGTAIQLLVPLAVPKDARHLPKSKAEAPRKKAASPAPDPAPAPGPARQPADADARGPAPIVPAGEEQQELTDADPDGFEEMTGEEERDEQEQPITLPSWAQKPTEASQRVQHYLVLTFDNVLILEKETAQWMGVSLGDFVRVEYDTENDEVALQVTRERDEQADWIVTREGTGKAVRAFLRNSQTAKLRAGFPRKLRNEPPDAVRIRLEPADTADGDVRSFQLDVDSVQMTKTVKGGVAVG